MPLAKRIIPCLDVDAGRVVKGVHFAKVKDAGDPVSLAKRYARQGADELVFLDITASHEGRKTMNDVVKKVASVIDIPFTVGGGIKDLTDAREILLSGADKVSINTAAVKDPSLITQLMSIFGKQCVVVAIDAKRNYEVAHSKTIFQDSKGTKFWFEVRIYGGREETGMEAVEWAKEVESRGAGEILLTSIDADGTENGYDTQLTRAICYSVRVPVIASGGCGSAHDMLVVFEEADADAALAASIFHYDKLTVVKVKQYLKKRGVKIRI